MPAQDISEGGSGLSIVEDPAGLKRGRGKDESWSVFYEMLKSEAEKQDKSQEWQSAMLSMVDTLNFQTAPYRIDKNTTTRTMKLLSGELGVYVCECLNLYQSHHV